MELYPKDIRNFFSGGVGGRSNLWQVLNVKKNLVEKSRKKMEEHLALTLFSKAQFLRSKAAEEKKLKHFSSKI